jgi:hypothetical protein
MKREDVISSLFYLNNPVILLQYWKRRPLKARMQIPPQMAVYPIKSKGRKKLKALPPMISDSPRFFFTSFFIFDIEQTKKLTLNNKHIITTSRISNKKNHYINLNQIVNYKLFSL